MKIVGIGDVHGRKEWKEVLNQVTDWDHVVFVGDYFDSYENFTPKQQIDNFEEIVSFKEANLDRVTLLYGNHDYHYVEETRYSGFNVALKPQIKYRLKELLKAGILQTCKTFELESGPWCFTHAGISEDWLVHQLDTYADIMGIHIDLDAIEDGNRKGLGPACRRDFNLEQFINTLMLERPKEFEIGYDMYGDHPMNSPIWVRPWSMEKCMLRTWQQVVGHTNGNRVRHIQRKGLSPDHTSMRIIDCLNHGRFLVIENGVAIETKLDQ